jgi:uncharacterized membrane protein
MLAGHFSYFYSHSYAWLILVVLMAVGAWIRLFFNLHHQGRDVWAIPVSAAAAVVVLAFVIEPSSGGGGAGGGPVVPFSTARRIVELRCQPCHSAQPTNPQFSSAPLGIELDTAEQIRQRAEQIRALAVDSTAMPLGNVTRMTPAERRLLGRWIAQGATISASAPG